MSARRIACLLPSATEIVCALGLREALVGISHECDFPPDVVGLPVLTEARIDPRRDSATIDAEVRALVRDGLSVYRIHTERLESLQPDLIVTQQQCEVCAVSYREVEEAARAVLGYDCPIVSLEPMVLDDIQRDIARVAVAAGVGERAESLTTALRGRLERIVVRCAGVRYRPRVACIEWLDPLMAAGNWVPEMIELCGGRSDLAARGEHSRTLSWDQLVAYDPEVLVLMPCGFPIAQTLAELPHLQQRPEWRKLLAVQQGRAFVADGNAYFNRPGPRIVDSAELLAGLIHPGLFAAGIPAASYVRVSDD